MEFGRSTTRFICFELKNSVLMFVLWFASVWKKIFFHWPLAKSLNQGSTAGGRSGVTHPDRGARSAATWIPGGQPPQGLSNVMDYRRMSPERLSLIHNTGISPLTYTISYHWFVTLNIPLHVSICGIIGNKAVSNKQKVVSIRYHIVRAGKA